MIWLNAIILAIIAVKTCLTSNKLDSFNEELLIKPLVSDQLYAHFQFTTKWDVDLTQESFRHTHIFPRPLSEIIERYNVQELHISLTNGLWRYESWGYPVVDASPGAEVWAWFKDDTENVNKNWKELASTLSGLFCASLNFIGEPNSVSPVYTFQPFGAVFNKVNSSYVRYGILPNEIVCTENLTPWKKLLPCDNKLGLASLLNSGYIHNTRYHSVGLHLRPICRNPLCKTTSLELQQSVSLVYDYNILGTKHWSFRRLFGQGVLTNCPLASSSNVYVDLTNTNYELTPQPDKIEVSTRGGYTTNYARYVIKQQPLTISASYTGKGDVSVLIPPALHASQYITGYGQERGGIVTKIYNNHWNSLDVVVLQNIPWYIPVYLHTLRIQNSAGEDDLKPISIKYSPGKLRFKPYYLETALRLPARSVTWVSIEFDYVYLKWQEYPPDANHGFYIGSSIVSSLLPVARNFTGIPQDGTAFADSFNASRNGYLVQIRTENMVITLPTPDFSMPYNVICLSCTVVALAFGPLHNITTKRLVLKAKDGEKFLHKLKNRLLKKFSCSSTSGGTGVTQEEK